MKIAEQLESIQQMARRDLSVPCVYKKEGRISGTTRLKNQVEDGADIYDLNHQNQVLCWYCPHPRHCNI